MTMHFLMAAGLVAGSTSIRGSGLLGALPKKRTGPVQEIKPDTLGGGANVVCPYSRGEGKDCIIMQVLHSLFSFYIND